MPGRTTYNKWVYKHFHQFPTRLLANNRWTRPRWCRNWFCGPGAHVILILQLAACLYNLLLIFKTKTRSMSRGKSWLLSGEHKVNGHRVQLDLVIRPHDVCEWGKHFHGNSEPHQSETPRLHFRIVGSVVFLVHVEKFIFLNTRLISHRSGHTVVARDVCRW